MRRPFRLPVVLIVATVAMCSLSGCRGAPPRSRAMIDSSTAPVASTRRASLPAARTGALLPDLISDSTWWRMITTMSEPGGYFRSENFVSNEMGVQRVIARLQESALPGGVYLGVGPEQNFTYIAALEPRVAFIVDIRRQNLLQHLWYKAVFELSPTRAAFLSRLFARPMSSLSMSVSADSLIARLERAPRDSALFEETRREVERHLLVVRRIPLDSTDVRTLRYIDSVFYLSGPELNYSSGLGNAGYSRAYRRMPSFADVARATDSTGRNIGFLSSEELYRRVRERQQRNLIVPLVGNFAGPQALRAVGAWLRERGATVDVFYTSNVEQYLFQQDDEWQRFYANTGTLPLSPKARYIRSVTSGWGAPRGGFLMTQLTSDIGEIVQGAARGEIRGYVDVIGRSVP